MVAADFFIDLPNFYSQLINSGLAESRLLRDYFLYWLDYDRLSQNVGGNFRSIWIFYSGNKLGRKSERLTDPYLKDYIKRINSQFGVTARDVNIPGEQREYAKYYCNKCKKEVTLDWQSEKGIDAFHDF